MKKILLAIAAVATITGCSQSEEFENPGQKAEMNFSTAVTRATALDTEGLQNAGFQVYAYNTGTTEMSTTAVLPSSAWIANKATYASTWSVAGGPYYWPLDENLQFFAYSPSDGVTYTGPDGTIAGYPKFTYKVGDTAADQKDLVISSVLNQTKETDKTAPVVSLNFKHALTQINVQVIKGSTDYTYEFAADNAVTISGIKGEGTFAYTGADTGDWTPEGTEATYTYTLGDFTDGTSAIVPGNALMLIPQDITDAKITIRYNTKKGDSYIFKGSKEIPLKSTTAWAFGTKILYKLTLPVGGEEVKIEATAAKWDTEKPETTEPSV